MVSITKVSLHGHNTLTKLSCQRYFDNFGYLLRFAQNMEGVFMFFDIFYDLCQQKRVSCKKAAEEIGLSNSITTKWKKTGATPGGDTLQRIANYFGVTTDYLLGKEKTPTVSGERDPIDDVDLAFYGEFKELSEDDKETVRDMVRIMRERRARKDK